LKINVFDPFLSYLTEKIEKLNARNESYTITRDGRFVVWSLEKAAKKSIDLGFQSQ